MCDATTRHRFSWCRRLLSPNIHVLLALVAIPQILPSMSLMLMDFPRIELPPLPSFDVSNRRSKSLEEPGFDLPDPRLNPKRLWEQAQAPTPRNRKHIYSCETAKDMETYKGQVRTPADAIILFEACRLGLLPRVQRRLSEKERQSIKSGSVFVWDEREAGMRRWTDGKSWSASRVAGSFLTYREMEGKRGGGQSNAFPPPPPPVPARSSGGRTPESGGGNTSDVELQQEEGPDGYRYKPDGLMKQSFSITTSTGNHLHLISYYSRSHSTAQQLPNPSSDPSLRHIRPAKGMYPESTVQEHQNIPAVTRSPMASGAPYSTVPQMAGYARHNPPGWPPQVNGHGWQQSHVPPHYPPQNYGYQYPPQNGGYYQAGPPPPASGQSPQQYSQPASQPLQQSPTSQSPYDERRPSHTPQTAQPIDPNLAAGETKSQPPTPEDRQAPPPLQHPQQHVYGYGSLENAPREGTPREQPYNPPPQYDSRRYPPQPNTPQDRLPPSSHHSQPPASTRGSYPPQHSQHPQQYYSYPPQDAPPHYGPQPPPPQYAQHPQYPQHPRHPPPQHYQQPPPPPPQHQSYQQPPPQHTPYPGPPQSNLQIDPALTSQPSPHHHQQAQSDTHSQSSTPNPPKPESASNATTYDSRGTTQPTTIPSIGALMNSSTAEQNGHSPSTTSNSNGNANGSGVATPVGADKSGDKSPGGGKKDGPQGIATDKVGFSEDRRALKVLDKGFR